MRRAVSLLVVLASVCPIRADDAKEVTIQFLGGAKKVPLDSLKVTLFQSRGDYTEDKKKPTTEGATDKRGTASFSLAPGRYYVEISSTNELPYLPLPIGFKDHPWHYDRTIEVGEAPRHEFDFNLADACRLTLKAVDADTGKAIPGVVFVTENALSEMWGMYIDGDNLGAKGARSDDEQMTDANGVFTRLVGPRPGFTYFAWPTPEGYQVVDKFEVEIQTPVGTAKAEHVFKFRKKK